MFLNALHCAKLSQIITDALKFFSIGMSPRLQLEQLCEHEFHQWLQQLQESPQSL